MRNLTCIVCPLGCSLAVEEGAAGADGRPSLSVTGNRCPRGAAYAQEEVRAPKRVVTATCAIAADGGGRGLYAPRRVPVKTAAACPKEQIAALLADIYRTTVRLPVRAGDAVITDWRGEGVNVVAVRTIA
jgi:CxxC motif-containing protein